MKLPSELTSLIHNVQLNKAGWWDDAIRRLIIAALWIESQPQEPQSVARLIQQRFEVELPDEVIADKLHSLLDASTVILLPDGKIKISESKLKEFEANLKLAEELEARVQTRFRSLISSRCPSLDPQETWSLFETELLVPIIQDLGARTYELISARKLELKQLPRIGQFLRRYEAAVRKPLELSIAEFLDPDATDIRSYILNQLNAVLVVESSNLAEDTVQALETLSGRRPRFTMFADTNFVFSILGLHENPSNQAAKQLLRLTDRVAGQITAKFLMLPPTVDEARAALTSRVGELGKMRMTPVLAEGVLKSDREDGLLRGFAEASIRTRQTISAAEYFGPYLENLMQIMRQKGVELHNENVDRYRTDSRVMDDINDQIAYQIRIQGQRDNRRRAPKPKTYEQLLHDIMLWHITRDKRPARVESPLEASYWVVTVDYRFLSYDERKRRKLTDVIPVCVHATTLIQLLQFWLPRSDELDKALLSSFRLPFLFREFDAVAEKATLRIVEALSRFEDVDDLPSNVIANVILNDALRQRLQIAKTNEDYDAVVREAVLEEFEQERDALQTQVEATSMKADALQAELSARNSEIATIRQQVTDLETLHREAVEARTTAKIAIQTDATRIQELESTRATLSSELDTTKSELLRLHTQHINKTRALFGTRWLAVPMIILCLLMIVGATVRSLRVQPYFTYYWSVVGIYSVLWIYMLDWRGGADPTIASTGWFVRFRKLRTLLFSFIGTILLGIFVNFATDFIKDRGNSSDGSATPHVEQPKSRN